MVNNELGLVMDRLDPVRGKIFWRSFGLTVASSTPSMVWLNPSHVDCAGDRVLCYFSTWIVHLKVRFVSCILWYLFSLNGGGNTADAHFYLISV